MILFISFKVAAVPNMKKIGVRSVPDPLSVFKDMFGEGVVEELLYKFTAFLSVRMGLEERGDLFTVFFKC